MNSTDVKLNYFISKLEGIKRLQAEFMMRKGEFDKEFGEWLKEKGVPENFSLPELIYKFRKGEKEIEVVLD